jgi:hypothetical protein
MYRAMRKKTQCATSLIFSRIRNHCYLETHLSSILRSHGQMLCSSWPLNPTCPGFHISILALLWSPRGIRAHKRQASWRPDAGSFGYLYSCTATPSKFDTRLHDACSLSPGQQHIILIYVTLMDRSIRFILFFLLFRYRLLREQSQLLSSDERCYRIF